MHLLTLILLNEPKPSTFSDILAKNLSELGSPALILLFLGLGFIVYYLTKQIKKKDDTIKEKEEKIQQLYNAALESSVKNLNIIHDISNTIDKSDERSRVIERLLMENNNFLKSIARSLNI